MSVAQVFGRGLAGPSYEFLSEVAVSCQLGLQSWKGLKVAVSCGRQAGAGCWQEASFLLYRSLSARLLERLHGMVAGCPQSKRSRRPRWIWQSLLNFILGVTLAKEWYGPIAFWGTSVAADLRRDRRRERAEALLTAWYFTSQEPASCVALTFPLTCHSWLVTWVLLPPFYR